MAQGGLTLAQGPPVPHLLLDPKVTGWGQGGTEPRTRGSGTVSPGTQWPAQRAKKGHNCTGTLENSQQPQDRPQAPGACGAADARGRAVVPIHTRKVCRAAGRTRKSDAKGLSCSSPLRLGESWVLNWPETQDTWKHVSPRPSRDDLPVARSIPGVEAPHLLARLLPWSREQRAINNH